MPFLLFAAFAAPPVDFAKDVAPIFADHCLSCHNPKSKKGGYDLSTFASSLKPGESGLAIVPKKLDDSPILGMIDGSTEPVMPKNAPLMDKAKIDVVRRWIAEGCACKDVDRDRTIREILGRPLKADASSAADAGRAAPILSLAFHPAKPQLFVPTPHKVVVVELEKRRKSSEWKTDLERVYSIRFSKDGKRALFTGGTPAARGVVELWNVEHASLLKRFDEIGDLFHSAAFSPDEKLVASAAADRGLYVWETESGKRLHRVENHAESAFATQFLPDGNRIVTSSRDRTVKIWDRKLGDVAATFANHGDAVFTAAASPDGETVCTGSADGRIRYWKSTGDGKEKATHFAHSGGVNSVVYSPDGKSVASAGADRSVKLWNAGGGIQKELKGHKDWVYALAYDSKGARLASGSWDGEVRVWDLASGNCTWSFRVRDLEAAKQ